MKNTILNPLRLGLVGLVAWSILHPMAVTAVEPLPRPDKVILVNFETGELDNEPANQSGALALTRSGSTTLYSEFGIISEIRPLHSRQSSLQTVDGPWIVTVVNDLQPAQIEQNVATVPGVVYCETVWADDDPAVGTPVMLAETERWTPFFGQFGG
jgi:hypothetical protein